MSESAPAPAAPRGLDAALKDAIRASYERLKQALPGFKSRAAQGQMIAAVARALAHDKAIAVVEAPTGTGKSMAYLVPGLAIAQSHRKRLIVSTATIALQEQLVSRDIPAFLAAVGGSAKVVLAKGRQRYACTRNMNELAHSDADLPQGGFDFGPDGWQNATWPRRPREGEPKQIADLLQQLLDRRWDGDLDRLPLALADDTRSLLTTSAGGCANRRCAFLQQCPFVHARNALRDADIVVANHDLVLADLMLGMDDDGSGGVLLPAPQDSLYVFDEAHHLASKAIDRGSAEVHLPDAIRRTARLAGPLRAVFASSGKERIGRLTADEIDATLQELDVLLDGLQRDIVQRWQPDPTELEPLWRAPLGQISEEWRLWAGALNEHTGKLLRWLPSALKTLLESTAPLDRREAIARELGLARERLERQHALWFLWSLEESGEHAPTARWIAPGHDGGLVCHASAVSAAPVLRRVLWPQAAGVVLTSATLSLGGDFRALHAQLGVPEHAESLSLASPFQLAQQATLEVPRLAAMPDAREAHVGEIVRWLERDLDWQQGNLVLFTSRQKLDATLAALSAPRRLRVKAQGSLSKAALLDAHAAAVGAGLGSTLFGLASFGEGLDLPGKLCETVVITQLPFAVPTDPVEATWAEWLESRGRNAFVEVSIPHATRTLIQYCGRLIRSENDVGRIVILDRRLVEKRYGASILRALPPFRQLIER